jgi:aspartate kinase
MEVLKFGGFSLDGPKRLAAAAQIVAEHHGHAQVIVVVSAMAGVTDALLLAADQIQRGDSAWEAGLARIAARHQEAYAALGAETPAAFKRDWAALLDEAAELAAAMRSNVPASERAGAAARFSGWGERLSVGLLVQALQAAGVPATGDTREPVILAADREQELSAALTRAWLAPRVAEMQARARVAVLPGYIARGAAGSVTTLGRNSSDQSAAVIAAALGAARLTIYSGVAGFYTADPRIVPDAALVPALHYTEAAAIALAGARVLHSGALPLVAEAGMPLHLRSSLAPAGPGTEIDTLVGHSRAATWVVAASPLRPDRVRAGVVEDWNPGLVEVTAHFLAAVGVPDDQGGAPRVFASDGAWALLTGSQRPVRLAYSKRRVAAVVPAAASAATQRRLHRALIPTAIGSLSGRRNAPSPAPASRSTAEGAEHETEDDIVRALPTQPGTRHGAQREGAA